MNRNKTSVKKIFNLLKKHYPHAKIALKYSNGFQLLVATILSAQCTDKRVNMVTPTLFKKYKSVKDFASADLNKLEQDIKSTGFYRTKAKNIKNCAQIILKKYNGRVPNSMDEMLALPGVARKTANIVLTNAYGIVEGIAVDTHVSRLSQRLGFTKQKNPGKIEQDLMKLFPKKEWATISYLLISHGRVICLAKKPKCKECFLNELCPFVYKA